MRRVLIFIVLFVALMGVMPVKADELEDTVRAIVQQHKVMRERYYAEWKRQNGEIRLLAEVIFWENWNTDKDRRAAYLTGAVVMNRVARDDRWLHLTGEKTVHDVVYARGQYSTTKYFYTQEIPSECLDMARDIYLNGTPDVPAGVIFQATFKQGPKYEVINGEWFCYG